LHLERHHLFQQDPPDQLIPEGLEVLGYLGYPENPVDPVHQGNLVHLQIPDYQGYPLNPQHLQRLLVHDMPKDLREKLRKAG
jgi:hypothetical protein